MDTPAFEQIIKRPISMIISVLCQLIGMPLLAYWFTLMFRLNVADRMGLFIVGCSPGGGSSNMWTFLMGGDLLLSICLTFINTLGTFGSMPAWFALLGPRVFVNVSSRTTNPFVYKHNFTMTKINSENPNQIFTPFVIPYDKIFLSLLTVSIPPLIGIALRRFKPNIATSLSRSAKPLTIFMIFLILVLGTWSNKYIFRVMIDPKMGGSWRLVFASMALPWSGFLLGYLACAIVNTYGFLSDKRKNMYKANYLNNSTKCPWLCGKLVNEVDVNSKNNNNIVSDDIVTNVKEGEETHNNVTTHDSKIREKLNYLNSPKSLITSHTLNNLKSLNHHKLPPPSYHCHHKKLLTHNDGTNKLSKLERFYILRNKYNKRLIIPKEQQIAILIETGLQNAGLAILLLWNSYPQPEADLAITVPVVCTIFTPIPLLIYFTIRSCLKWVRRRKTDKLVISDPL
ncbi:unnamed protein product [Gordionus sp. m RMFG-2023]